MKYCETYAALLDLFVDGELSYEELLEVQAHLDECPACRSYVDDALAMRAAFPDAEDTEVPRDFAAGVMAAIQADPALRPAVSPRKKKKTPWVGVLASLAACCAIVILQQNGPLAGGGNRSASVACDTAAEERAAECETSASYTYTTAEEPEEAVEDAAADTGAESGASTRNEAVQSPASAETEAATSPTALLTDSASPKEADLTEDSWVEHGNIVFSCIVYLPRERVGHVLDGYEGKPFSNARLPEEGVIGIGYALEQTEFERILYDEFDYPHGPMLNQERTTDLCCIVVTEDPAIS